MLKDIFQTCAKKPFLNKSEQTEFFAKIQAEEKRAEVKIWGKEIAGALGMNPDTFSRRKKLNKIPRLLSYLVDSADKAQKYEEIKKI